MILALSAVILTLTATLANAQQNSTTYLAGLVQTLNNAGLTSLANAVGLVNSTSAGSQLLSSLSNTNNNYTVFAPNNDAFSNATSDPNAITDVVAYHVVFGHFKNVTDYPNTTIGRTALGDPSVVMLEGNKNQVVAWARRSDGLVHVLNQNQTDDPHVEQLLSYQNLDIYVINGVLTYPADIRNTYKSNTQLSGFATLANSTEVPIWDTGNNTTENVTVTDVLYGVRGLTLFVPSNDAASQLSQFSSNETELWDILRNHVINATTVYSPSFVNVTYTSAAGENLHFSSNSSGKFVTSGNTTAAIIQPDVLLKNGVIHIIDRVLLNADVNEGAASHAYSSATSAAGHSSTETGPVGVPTGGSNNGGTKNGAVGSVKGVSTFSVVVASVILGSFFLFA
jgi:uncharacterized surface protein with fasciclin (FAS1) repeats